MPTRSQGKAVPDECWEHYEHIKYNSPDTLRIIEKITGNDADSFQTLGKESSLLAVYCSTIDSQKAAYDQLKDEIELLNEKLEELNLRRGGSQSGGADCPADFQKIFNYMFLIAASASIAIMSPDIELVTKVCMNALKLVFGTIVLPIINLLSVIFTFMLKSLVLIVKTLGTFAVQIISNFIKTVCLNIHTIASGAIGVAKVFIYNTLTYCGSFYKQVVGAMIADEKILDPTRNDGKLIEKPEVTMILPENIDEINISMNEAVKTELLGNDMTIDINEEPDIFMDMLTNFGEIYDAIRKQIKFGYTFLKTAYFLLCENAHHIIKDKLGAALFSDKAKLSLTKGLIYAENSVIRAVNEVARFPDNVQAVIIYNINVLCLKILKIVYSGKIEKRGRQERVRQERVRQERHETRGNENHSQRSRERSRERNSEDRDELEDNMIQSIGKTLDTDESELVFNLDIESLKVPKDVNIVKKNIKSIETDVGQLTDNIEYVSIMEDLNIKLKEIIDPSNPPAFMNKGGAKKRRTKKAKKHIKKRRYSRKH